MTFKQRFLTPSDERRSSLAQGVPPRSRHADTGLPTTPQFRHDWQTAHPGRPPSLWVWGIVPHDWRLFDCQAACRSTIRSLKSGSTTNCSVVVRHSAGAGMPFDGKTSYEIGPSQHPRSRPVTDLRPLRPGVIAVIVRDERLLVIRRSQFVVAPRAICFPGGGIEQDESQEQALVREMQEELAAVVVPLYRVWSSTNHAGTPLAWWRAELAPGAVPVAQPAEVESIHWYTPAELTDLGDLLASNRAFLAAVDRGDVRLD